MKKIQNINKVGLAFLVLVPFLLGTIFFIFKNVDAQPADSPWPVFGHDSKHTNLSPYGVGKEKKDVAWSYKTDSNIESSPAVGSDGTIYVGSHDGCFYAFNPDGTLKWKVKLTEPVYDKRWNVSKAMMASPAISKDGTIYINSASGYLHAFNSEGKEKWRFPIKWSNDFWNSPNIGPDGTIYIGTARDDNNGSGLVAINPDGTEKWRSLEPSGVTIVPSITDDGAIIFGAADTISNKGKIISLDSSGKKKWEFWLEEWLEGSAAIGDDGTIYSSSKEGNFYATNPDGKELWRFKTGDGISATPTIGSDGNVYIGSWDGVFYALDQKSGKEKWHFDAKVGRDPKLFKGYPGKETLITNAALSKDGVLVFADVFDTVYAFDTSGKELWRWKNSEGGGYASSPAIGSDGTIYIGGENGYFYAIGKAKTNTQESGSAENNQSKKLELPLTTVILITVFAIVLAGIIYIFHLRKKESNKNGEKKLNIKILVIVLSTTLVILAVVAAAIFFISQEKHNKKASDNTNTSPVQQTESSGKEFDKYAAEIPGPVKIKVRDYGETVRSCIGKGCGALKDSCVRWNKNKDQCYEMIKTSPASSDKYKVYCNLVIVNQDFQKAANISVDLKYITGDSMEHLVKKESLQLDSGKGSSIRWDYDVAETDLGECGYSNLEVKVAD